VPVARDIANGEAAIKARPELKPHLEKFTGDGDITLGNLRGAFMAMPAEYGRVVNAAQAIYAKRAGDAGLIGSDVANKGNAAFAAALDAATGAHYVNGEKIGGLTLYNGAPVIAPNGVKADGFEDLAHQLTARDLARASVTGAPPVIGPRPQAPDLTNNFNSHLSPADEQKFQTWVRDTGRTKDLFDYDLRGAWKAGAQQAANGHFTDAFKKPNHPTFSTESIYSGHDGAVGGQWIQHGKNWTFKASPTNLQMHSADQLGGYFAKVEPDSKLILPPGADVGPSVPDDLMANSWLISTGNNRYAISTTDPSKGQATPVRDANGQIYRLDFAKAQTLLQARGK
jgi:hypothetical protein